MNLPTTKYVLLTALLGAASTLSVFAQEKAQFLQTEVDLGAVKWKEAATAQFQIKNSSHHPLTIVDVRKDCGCTDVAFPQTVAAGATAAITVKYDAATLGHFHRQVAVTTSASNVLTYLTIRGRVYDPNSTMGMELPYKIGDFSLSTDHLEFDDVCLGQRLQKTIYLRNGSKENYMPELMHLPKYLTAYAEPEIVRPGKVGKLHLTLDGSELLDIGLTQTDIYLSRFPGDHVGKHNEIGVSAMVLPQQTFTDAQRAIAPVAQLDTVINLGAFGKKTKLKGEIELANVGQSPLEVSMMQVYNPSLGVSLAKAKIPAGQKTKLKITAAALRGITKGSQRILLITNDPKRPKIVITVLTKN